MSHDHILGSILGAMRNAWSFRKNDFIMMRGAAGLAHG
ncbi:hypothetical protein C4J94_2059 [Pseudomonas sp. R5-89-07]|nr:hypothetical protein C4J94_2059 [Pseudomonas sp. R5-89-07]